MFKRACMITQVVTSTCGHGPTIAISRARVARARHWHSTGRKTKPLEKHDRDWRSALVRPEGITAVVLWMSMWLGLSLAAPQVLRGAVPACIQDLSPRVAVGPLLTYFLVFDMLMWLVHVTQHNVHWLYKATHSRHHTIASPTIIVALTGFLPDTVLLILIPLHGTLFIVPGSTFATVVVFATAALIHLHMIHSSFKLPWDHAFRSLGIVNTYDHHVHHIHPKRNLAHFFTSIDRLLGTYVDPANLPNFGEQLANVAKSGHAALCVSACAAVWTFTQAW
eukprot:m.122882 g.122882  ORF g.122882 m.122882 type:complete len:279 (-) comp16577_c0_seq7:71-907(-)